MEQIKVVREQDITCERFTGDNQTVEVETYPTTQRVEIEQEEEGKAFTSIVHNGESLSMSIENLQILFSLIGGALGEYYNELAKQNFSIEVELERRILNLLERKPRENEDRSYGKLVLSLKDFVSNLNNPSTILGPILESMVKRGSLKTSTFRSGAVGYRLS